MIRAALFATLLCLLPVAAEVQWKAPAALAVGEMAVLELRESDSAKPPLLRPPLEERVGALRIRGMEPSPDGRGWRVHVLPLGPGSSVLPPMDLGDGRRSPELRVTAPRTVPFGSPWMGVGGGPEDEVPRLPFPWAWASLALMPLVLLIWWGLLRWRKGAAARVRRQAWKGFARHWPPPLLDRTTLDGSHQAGRALLEAHFGEASKSWGPAEFRARHLEPWDTWVQSLDAARFSRTEPPFPSLQALEAPLGRRP